MPANLENSAVATGKQKVSFHPIPKKGNAKPFVKWIVQKNSKGRQLCHALPCIVTGVAAGAAKLLQSCPTLCDPIDGSPPGSPIPGIVQARTLEWVAISFSSA